jgi:hypothetical protein
MRVNDKNDVVNGCLSIGAVAAFCLVSTPDKFSCGYPRYLDFGLTCTPIKLKIASHWKVYVLIPAFLTFVTGGVESQVTNSGNDQQFLSFCYEDIHSFDY